jgi:hypothetical protein
LSVNESKIKEARKWGEHIGDIDDFWFIKFQDYYSLWDGNELVASFFGNETYDNIEIKRYSENEKYSSSLPFAKIVLFFTTRFGWNVIIGDSSIDIFSCIDNLWRFDMLWIELNSTKEVKLDVNNIQQEIEYNNFDTQQLKIKKWMHDGNRFWKKFNHEQRFMPEAFYQNYLMTRQGTIKNNEFSK